MTGRHRERASAEARVCTRASRAGRGSVRHWIAVASLAYAACSPPASAPEVERAPALAQTTALHPVQIVQPQTLGVIDTQQTTASGTPAGIACATCHAAGLRTAIAARPDAPPFHLGVDLQHGGLRCTACHAPADRTRLRLADGEEISFGEVMRLCGQCHGPQLRDYQHGAHGGMRGYWDLSRGPRQRNSCIVCHGAHQPAYPHVIPAPPPRDRFLGRGAHPAQGDPHER